jgi:hypothetical protein
VSDKLSSSSAVNGWSGKDTSRNIRMHACVHMWEGEGGEVDCKENIKCQRSKKNYFSIMPF